jgi:hypothetical protein
MSTNTSNQHDSVSTLRLLSQCGSITSPPAESLALRGGFHPRRLTPIYGPPAAEQVTLSIASLCPERRDVHGCSWRPTASLSHWLPGEGAERKSGSSLGGGFPHRFDSDLGQT